MNAIEIQNLSKAFHGMYAVDHLNMTVPEGAIYGFIGENGSGKSTTEKLICGLLVPTCGKIRLFGKIVPKPADQGGNRCSDRESRLFSRQQRISELVYAGAEPRYRSPGR